MNRPDATSNTVVATIPVGMGPVGVAVSPDSRRVYVANDDTPQGNSLGNTVSVIDPSTNKVAQQFFGEGGDSIRAGLGWIWLTNIPGWHAPLRHELPRQQRLGDRHGQREQ